MLYLIAILLPPVAVALAGKPFQAILNLVLTLMLYLPGLLHALLVVHNHYADKRAARIADAMKKEARREARKTASRSASRSRSSKAKATPA
jgi:uncharacterized membrane protein YqaE (UPF0057 family)